MLFSFTKKLLEIGYKIIGIDNLNDFIWIKFKKQNHTFKNKIILILKQIKRNYILV